MCTKLFILRRGAKHLHIEFADVIVNDRETIRYRSHVIYQSSSVGRQTIECEFQREVEEKESTKLNEHTNDGVCVCVCKKLR